MEQMTLWKLFKDGGWAMWPLLLFSIATFSLIIERIIFLASHNLKVKDIYADIIDFIKAGKIEDAKKKCDEYEDKKIGAKIIKSGLNMAHLGEHRMEKSVETVAAEKINDLERGFNFLVALGSIAPITGFLGTVSGMINAFAKIAAAADVDVQLVAGGINEAMITTAFGLSISIFAIAAYNVFTHIVDTFSADIESIGANIITEVLVADKNK